MGIPAGIAFSIGFTAPLWAAQAEVRPPPTRVTREARPSRYEGRRVADVLAQLQADGVRIIFTSSLVPSGLLVKVEPRTRLPRQLAAEILAPHGLALENGPGGIWLVVRADVPVPSVLRPPSSTRGAPRSSTSAAPTVGTAEEDRHAAVSPYVEEQIDVTERIGEFAGQPSVRHLDAAAVRQAAGGFENLFHVMPTLPGIAATDDKQGKLAVRGTGPQHNVVLFDGVQVHSPQRFGSYPTSFVNPETTASMAIDTSGLDARHGGRLSSVTVVETRDGRTDRRLALSGSASLTNGDLLAEGRVPGTTAGSWWATVRGTYYRPIVQAFDDGVIPNFADVQLKVTLRPSAQTRLSLFGLIGREGVIRRTSAEAVTPDAIWRRLDAESRLRAATFWWAPNRRVSTTTTISAYDNRSSYFNVLSFGVGGFASGYRISDLALRQRVALVWRPGHALDTGVEVNRIRSHWQTHGHAPPPIDGTSDPDPTGPIGELDVPTYSRLARTQVGTWVQERIPIGARLEFEPGLRLDWNSLTDERALQPRARLSARVGGAVIWAGLAWQAQTPGHEAMQQGLELYNFSVPGASNPLNLRNERSRQVVFGVERPLGHHLSVRVEAYRRRFDRLLVPRQESGWERAQRLAPYEIPPDMPPDSALLEYRPTVDPRSAGTGRASGLELLLQRDGARLSGWVTYTLSKSTRELFGRTVPFAFDRRHAVGAVASLRLTRAFRLATTWQFASGFPVTPLTPEVMFSEHREPGGPLVMRPERLPSGHPMLASALEPRRLSRWNSERLHAYVRLDQRVTWAPSPRWELYGEVINLFDHANLEQSTLWNVGGFEERGRHAVYDRYGRLYSYGVRVRF